MDSVATLDATSSVSSLSPIDYGGDWQKTLLGTMGTSTWATENSSTGSSSIQTPDKLTLTDQLGRNLFTGYMQLKQEGMSDDPQSQQDLIGQVLSDGTFVPAQKTYDKSEIKITSDNSKATIMAYGNAVGLVFKTHKAKGSIPELDIVQASLDKNDPTILQQLNPIIANNSAVLKSLLAIPVPSAMASIHLNLVNAINEILFADQGFTKTFSDGVVSLQAIAKYQEGVTALGKSLIALHTYFASVNIIFGPTDAGSMFTSQPQSQ